MNPVTKLWAVKSNLQRVVDYDKNAEKTAAKVETEAEKIGDSLGNEIDYVANGEKTVGEEYVEGINCHAVSAYEEFEGIKKAYNKNDGVLAYHGVLSFPQDERVTPDLAFEIGKEFVRRNWGDRFQVLVSLHTDTDNYHCHYLINSVSFVDGKKATNKDRNWYRLRHVADEIFEEHGLHVDKKAKKTELGFAEPTHKAAAEKRTEKNSGDNWDGGSVTKKPSLRDLARMAIDDAIGQSRSLHEFKYHLKRMGYTLGDSPTRKYWTITYGDRKPIRVYQLGEKYSEAAITRRLNENENNPNFVPIILGASRERMYKFKTRGERANEKSGNGIKGTYIKIYVRMELMYSYYRTPNYRRMNPAVREAIEWIDKLNDETSFCYRHNINNLNDLASYRESVEEKMESAAKDRRECRNAERRIGVTDEEVEELKRRIATRSEEMKGLRKELALCDSIRERSAGLKSKINRVVEDEQKAIRRKEEKKNEHRSRSSR